MWPLAPEEVLHVKVSWNMVKPASLGNPRKVPHELVLTSVPIGPSNVGCLQNMEQIPTPAFSCAKEKQGQM